MKIILTIMSVLSLALMPTQSFAMDAVPGPRSCGQNSNNDKICLACVVFYEARGEPTRGQLAVGSVVMNRVNNDKFPSNICSVVYQRSQFSWTAGLPKIKSKPTQWESSINMADKIISGNYQDASNGAIFFHNSKIRPSFAKTKQVVARIGNHVFKK